MTAYNYNSDDLAAVLEALLDGHGTYFDRAAWDMLKTQAESITEPTQGDFRAGLVQAMQPYLPSHRRVYGPHNISSGN